MVRKHAKQLLEQSLMELLDETTLDKIDVRELTSKANLSRQTFYYNFKNKQDMVNWIFDKNNEAARQVFLKNHSIREYILTVLNTIVKYRTFYANVLVGEYGESGMPGPFENGIIRSVQEIELHSPKGRMSTEQWDALVFFAFGTKGMVMYWITGDMRMDAEAMTDVILSNMPSSLKDYIEESTKKYEVFTSC